MPRITKRNGPVVSRRARRLLSGAATALLAVLVLSAGAASAAPLKGGVNRLVPNASVSAVFCALPQDGSEHALCDLTFHTPQLSQDGYVIGCDECGKYGNFAGWKQDGANGETAPAPRPIGPVRSNTTFWLLLTQPGEIGRYRQYRPVGLNTAHPRLVLERQTCIAANVPTRQLWAEAGDLKLLPDVPCKPPNTTVSLAWYGMNELSTVGDNYGVIQGRVSAPTEITIAQVTGPCPADPEAFSAAKLKQHIWQNFHVNGSYEQGIAANPIAASGNFCVYMQSGARAAGVSDGWLLAMYQNSFRTGDSLTSPPAVSLAAAGTTSTTLTGNASTAEQLVVYDSYLPCAQYAGQASTTAFNSYTVSVKRGFSQTVTSGTFQQSGYVCAYLLEGVGDYGLTLALATEVVTVAATPFQDTAAFNETAWQTATPISDPVDLSGPSTTAIQPQQTVQVRCIVTASGPLPGDVEWYEVESVPWADTYYVPSGDFYNNGATSGSNANSPMYDSAVPNCGTAPR